VNESRFQTINKRRLEKENLVYVPENKNWTGRAMKDFTRVVVRCADVVKEKK